jgi:hypothetical protein
MIWPRRKSPPIKGKALPLYRLADTLFTPAHKISAGDLRLTETALLKSRMASAGHAGSFRLRFSFVA